MNNLELLQARLKNRGGQLQQDRMIADKIRTLRHAIANSYQGTTVSLMELNEQGELVALKDNFPALINPNRLLADYDEKIISAEYRDGLNVGSIIQWQRNTKDSFNKETYWIVYLQDLTELAYFKADIRRCNYKINYINKETNKIEMVYASILGPDEKNISSVYKSQFRMDVPNYTITLLLPNNKNISSYFQRYAKFYLTNLEQDNTPKCWRVEAVDSISIPGILEVHAREYYINDDQDKDNIVDNLIQQNLNNINTEQNNGIVGDTIIMPKFTYIYNCEQIIDNGTWSVDQNLPITLSILSNNTVEITWEALYSGNFTLKYGTDSNKIEKNIIVDSLF